MRMLLVASWHHFAFLVISIALLGFAASGTILAVARSWWLQIGETALPALAIAAAIAMPTCWNLAQQLSVDVRLVPAVLWKQLGSWLVYWLLLAMPFAAGGLAVGLALMLAGRRIGSVYAANLIGSGSGALALTLALTWLDPSWLAPICGAVGLLAILPAACWSWPRRAGTASTGIVILLLQAAVTSEIDVDPYKARYQVAQLERQGLARPLAAAESARGRIEVFGGERFHRLNFLSLEAQPPLLNAILIDGHYAGSMLTASKAAEAAAVDHLLTAAAYHLAPASPEVLLLGEIGGVNLWLARRQGAESVRIVQPLAALGQLMRGPLSESGGLVFSLPGVTVIVDEPRHYVDRSDRLYDLIQLSSLEGSAVGSGGLGGLEKDFLATRAGIAACIDRLRPNGVLAVARGIQTPPRDNLKIFATVVAALRDRGILEPGNHLVVLRDFLGVCTLVRPTSWPSDTAGLVRALCASRQLTPVWFPGVDPDELNLPDALPLAPHSTGDWYHYAITQLIAGDQVAQDFVERYAFDIRPPSDDRPFFSDFARLQTIVEMREVLGDLWLTRAELGFLTVLGGLGAVALFGVAFIACPLVVAGRIHRWRGVAPTSLYFGAIGGGYLMFEIALMSDLTHLFGAPVLAAAVTISTFLISSGCGSLLVAHRSLSVTCARWILVAIAAAGSLELAVLPTVLRETSGIGLFARVAVAIAAIAPLGFLMGFALPAGLSRLDRAVPQLLPWAWGVNGLASVAAPPLATALAMSRGFDFAGGVAIGMYLFAALIFAHLPNSLPMSTVSPILPNERV